MQALQLLFRIVGQQLPARSFHAILAQLGVLFGGHLPGRRTAGHRSGRAAGAGLCRRKVQTLRCVGAVCGSVIPPIVRRQLTLSAATIHPKVIPVCV